MRNSNNRSNEGARNKGGAYDASSHYRSSGNGNGNGGNGNGNGGGGNNKKERDGTAANRKSSAGGAGNDAKLPGADFKVSRKRCQ